MVGMCREAQLPAMGTNGAVRFVVDHGAQSETGSGAHSYWFLLGDPHFLKIPLLPKMASQLGITLEPLCVCRGVSHIEAGVRGRESRVESWRVGTQRCW